jgi:chromate reductase
MHLLAISGSLRAASSNTAVLAAASKLAPAGVTIELFDGLGALPHFNPDLDSEPLPEAVARFRASIGASHGLLISSPEYTRGAPGTLKNALDWLVASFEFPNKPVALINTSPRAIHALASLTTTLETMSARVVSDASVTLPLLGTTLDADNIVATPAIAQPLHDAIAAFVSAIERMRLSADADDGLGGQARQ